jgi:hypothetical protein
LVLGLFGVPFIDSAGLGAFSLVSAECTSAGQPSWCRPVERPSRVSLNLVGSTLSRPPVPSLEDAVALLRVKPVVASS